MEVKDPLVDVDVDKCDPDEDEDDPDDEETGEPEEVLVAFEGNTPLVIEAPLEELVEGAEPLGVHPAKLRSKTKLATGPVAGVK